MVWTLGFLVCYSVRLLCILFERLWQSRVITNDWKTDNFSFLFSKKSRILATVYLWSSPQTSRKLWWKCFWKPPPSTQRMEMWTGTPNFCQCKSSLTTWMLSLMKGFSLTLTKVSQHSSPLYSCSQIEGVWIARVDYYVSENCLDHQAQTTEANCLKSS